MTENCKTRYRGNCLPGNHEGLTDPDPEMPDDGCTRCSTAHIEEFGNCVGIVAGLTNYNNVPSDHPDFDPNKIGPEWDVYWQPSNLRYAYDPNDLELVG